MPSDTTAATVGWIRDRLGPCRVVDHEGNRMTDLVDLVLKPKTQETP